MEYGIGKGDKRKMKITMAHGSGGHATRELIDHLFKEQFSNDVLNQMNDAAVLDVPSQKVAFTTDSFVVTPLFFEGSDIGKLSICGTVNDLLMVGAVPKYLTAGFIIEEGLDYELLQKAVQSMREASMEAGIHIVAGDTKVVEGNGGLYINTAGIGFVSADRSVDISNVSEGDAVILSGSLGNHHACILSHRMNIKNQIQSDCAPLNQMVLGLLDAGVQVNAMRDVTRGGLATVLNEIAESANVVINIGEESIPVDQDVKSFCGILGLDPLYMGNEGKMVCIVPERDSQKALGIIKNSKYGAQAAVIGNVEQKGQKKVTVTTRLGGKRVIDVLYGEGLPRIC